MKSDIHGHFVKTAWKSLMPFTGAVRAVAATALLMGLPGAALAGGETVVTAATGGETIHADTAGGAWTELTGPIIDETYARDIGFQATGTIVLNVPTGFEFNPDAVVNVRVGGLGPKPINGEPEGTLLPADVTPTTITILITSESRGGLAWPGYLIYEGIQVRPTAVSPLAVGHLTHTGTCNFRNLTLASGTWGLLRQIGGAAAGYVITGPTSATAGEPTTITIQKVDDYGNPISGGSTETLIFTGLNPIDEYAPTINGSADAFTTGITVVFDENGTATVILIPYSAGQGTINVTDGDLSSSGNGGGLPITILPGTASTVTISLSDENLVYGSTFDVTIQSHDEFGNISASGLPSSLPVTLGLTDGVSLIGSTLTQDIGSSAGNGSAVYEGLQTPNAGQNTIVASTSGGPLGSITIMISKLALLPAVLVSDKVYDGTTSASILQTSLTTVLSGDEVQLSGTAAFQSKHVGANKEVLVSEMTLNGADAQNYDLTTTMLTTYASITPRHVTVLPNSDRKTYDGTPASHQTPAVANLVDGDSAQVVQFFCDKETGAPKTLIPAGALADGNNGNNYIVTWKDEANGAIEPRPLTIVATASSKVYDGTTAAAVSLSDDRLAGDNFLVKYAAAEFIDSSVGSKEVVISGITLEGADAQNYISPASITTTAEIMKAPLTVSADDKTREFGQANPILTGSITGVQGADVFSLTFSTPAQPTSRAGVYGITPEIQDPHNRLANYALTINPGFLTILSASSSIEVFASAYPSLEGSNVTFTVVVQADASGDLPPGGNVRVVINGVVVEDSIPLINGTASMETSNLPQGQNLVTAEYSGDDSHEPESTTVEHLVVPMLPEPVIVDVSRDGSNITVKFQGNPGWRYTVQATSHLEPPVVWEDLITNTVSSLDGTWTYTDDMSLHPQRFFRAVNAEMAQ